MNLLSFFLDNRQGASHCDPNLSSPQKAEMVHGDGTASARPQRKQKVQRPGPHPVADDSHM